MVDRRELSVSFLPTRKEADVSHSLIAVVGDGERELNVLPQGHRCGRGLVLLPAPK